MKKQGWATGYDKNQRQRVLSVSLFHVALSWGGNS
jgi:hypothetical protein